MCAEPLFQSLSGTESSCLRLKKPILEESLQRNRGKQPFWGWEVVDAQGAGKGTARTEGVGEGKSRASLDRSERAGLTSRSGRAGVAR